MGINYEESCRQLVNCIEERIIWIESNYWDNQTEKNKYYLDKARENWDNVDEDNIKNLSDFKIYINYLLRKMDK
jgi:trans-2-enoyl-CoA reductase